MKTARSLTALFASLLPVLLATPLGCGGSVGPGASSSGSSSGGDADGGVSVPTFSASLCSDEGYRPLEDLSVPGFGQGGVEYIELRDGYPESQQAPQLLASIGTKCQSATDQAACNAAVAAATVSAGFETLPDALPQSGYVQRMTRYLVTTQGGTVRTITNAEQLAQLLGPIDTLHEAALVASVRNHEIVCPPAEPHSSGEAYTPAGQSAASFRLVTFTGIACGAGSSRDALTVSVAPSGDLTVDARSVVKHGDGACAIGRRPVGLRSRGATGLDDLGAFFAEIAHLESASVTAFAQIEHELELLGAPRSLRRRARRARLDEIRHAAQTTELAARFGAEVRSPEVTESVPRDKFRFALDNAVEGCVKETFGALLAEAQAAHASDPEIACILRGIAHDETEHAALSWKMAAWIEPTLSASERRTIAAAKQRAVCELQRILQRQFDPAVESLAGMPDPAGARALLDGLSPHLLRDAA